jgi:hypothetical protein
MSIEIVGVFVLGFLLVFFLAYLYVKYRGRPRPRFDLILDSGMCCYCMNEATEDFFCGPCYRRLAFRFTAILAGVFCIPVGAMGGCLFDVAAGNPAGQSVFAGIIACVVLYSAIVWTYILVWMPQRVRWHPTGFGFDPTGIRFSSRVEWWLLKLVVRQSFGARRPPKEGG